MYNPLTVSDLTARQIMLFAKRYVAKHSQADGPRPLSPEAREEITARIIYDWQTADYSEFEPESDIHAAARQCRWWRLRGWHGTTQDDEREKKRAAKAAKAHAAAGWDATPSSGTSEDSRTPSPLAILMAEESAQHGLRYVSDRQREGRRKAVKTRNRHFILISVVERYETYTAIRCERVTIYGVRHKGTIANRNIGKAKTEKVSFAAKIKAVLRGRDSQGRFVPDRIPAIAIAAAASVTIGVVAVACDIESYRQALRDYYEAK